MSNSALVTCTRISPNRTSPRQHAIDTVTIHCFVGQVTAQQGCNSSGFTTPGSSNSCSCNYVVGRDGSIGLVVEEGDRSWCSSNADNDHRAITIEVACEPYHPYEVTDAAYQALIDLLADICRRNPGIGELRWEGDKSLIGQTARQNMTVHRWFANKACPGDWLYERHGQIAEAVNTRLRGGIDMTKDEVKQLIRETVAEMEAEQAAQPASLWAVETQVIARAVEAGVSDGTRPRSTMTREEGMAMILAATGK